ncbi:MAG: hypothetical protein ACREGF_00525, partial [Candidatus Saccharimonadales bacterium]
LLRIPAFNCRLRHGETLETVRQRFPEVPNMMLSAAPENSGQVTIQAFDYSLAAHNGVATLWSVSERFNLEFDDLLAANLERKGLFAPGTRLLHAFTETKTVKQILDDLQTGEKFSLSNVGGTASRFFLHGLRIPAVSPATNRIALFEATGQQFDWTGLTDKSTIALSMNAETAKPAWLQFEDTDKTSFPVTTAMASSATALQTSAFVPPLTLDAQNDIRRYRLQAKTFSLPDGLQWADPNPVGAAAGLTDSFIWKFPSKLQQYLFNNPGLPYELALQSKSTAFTQRASEPVTPQFWATSVDVAILQIPSTGDPKTPMQNVYVVQGCGDADGQLLEQLILANPAIVNLDILYADNSAKKNDGKQVTGMVSNPLGEYKTFLLQTNYSTVSGPALRTAAGAEEAVPTNLVGMDAVTFITYLWECSIVRSGGYYLYYNNGAGGGLPAYLFAEDGRATISILVSYAIQPQSGTSAYLLPGYVNSAVINQKIEPKEDNLYVGVYLTDAQQATFNPAVQTITSILLSGTGQFRGTRTNPALMQAAGLEETVDQQLSELFNLLEYRIDKTAGVFTETKFALPAGPVTVDESGPLSLSAAPRRALATDGWIFSSVVPIYPFVDPQATNLPATDPYRANGKAASIYFNFLDIFGNTLFPDGTGESGSNITQTITPLYTDPVIGLNQWVNVSKYFDITLDSKTSKPTLTITLQFDKSRYTGAADPAAMAKRDLEFYQNVWNQLAQPDIEVDVLATIGTLLPPDETPLKKLQKYLGELMAYLETLVPQKNAGPDLITATIPFTIDTANINPALIFALAVNVGIKRTANIDPQFEQEPGIRFADTIIPPDLYTKDGAAGSPFDRFATLLEAALPVMRVTVGQPKLDIKTNVSFGERIAAANDASAEDQEVWLIRYAGATGQAGIAFTVDPHPAYFATKPLSTKLISRPDNQNPNPVPIRTYATGTYLADVAPEPKNYADIDIEVLARVFVTAMDGFLSADMSAKAWNIQYAGNTGADEGDPKTTPFQVVEQAKKDVAAAIAQYQLSPILQG